MFSKENILQLLNVLHFKLRTQADYQKCPDKGQKEKNLNSKLKKLSKLKLCGSGNLVETLQRIIMPECLQKPTVAEKKSDLFCVETNSR